MNAKYVYYVIFVIEFALFSAAVSIFKGYTKGFFLDSEQFWVFSNKCDVTCVMCIWIID